MSHVHVHVLRVAKPLYYDVQTTPFRRHYDVIILLCVLRVALSGMALHETEQPEPQIQIGRGTEDYSHHCQQATL